MSPSLTADTSKGYAWENEAFVERPYPFLASGATIDLSTCEYTRNREEG